MSSGSSSGTTSGSPAIAREPGTREVRITLTTPRAFLANAAGTVKKLRNHPSLLVWTAGNEGYPREEIYRPLRDDIVAGLDGTRPFIPSSGYREPPKGWGLSWPDNGPAGTYSGGPYYWVDPGQYYRLVAGGKDWLFKNEAGIPSVPVLESLGEFLPPEPDPAVKFPLNDVWGYHDACEDNGKYSLYDQAIRERYGEPANLADYARKAQLVNAESYRALFEAVNQAGSKTSGVMLWKGNPAWPSVSWQIYDWYLRPHAGYYFIKKACEPLHIQLNPSDGSAWVVNATREDRRNLEARIRIYDPTFKLTRESSATIDVPAGSVREVPDASAREVARSAPDSPSAGLLPPGGAGYVALRLYDKGKLVSDNFYWLSPDGRFGFLASLPPAGLEVSAKRGLDRRPTRSPGPAEEWRESPRVLHFPARRQGRQGNPAELLERRLLDPPARRVAGRHLEIYRRDSRPRNRCGSRSRAGTSRPKPRQ